MKKRIRKKILKAGYNHPLFWGAVKEEYFLSATQVGEQLVNVFTNFCEQLQNAAAQIVKYVDEHKGEKEESAKNTE